MFKVKDHVTKEVLNELLFSVLREIGGAIGVKSPTSRTKGELIELILDMKEERIQPYVSTQGAPKKSSNIDISEYVYEVGGKEDKRKIVLSDKETRPEGLFVAEGYFEQTAGTYGFLRKTPLVITQEKDTYVSGQLIKEYNLKEGDFVEVKAEFHNQNDSSARVKEVLSINGQKAESHYKRKRFSELVPCYPNSRIKLENDTNAFDIAIRTIDLFAPIGKGQRGLIVAPPKTGKTTLIKKIAKAIEDNYKDIELMVLLIDERPEEVTDIRSSINSMVLASTFDNPQEEHIKVAKYALERAKSLVEYDKDVVVLMDSITRLVRASNNTVTPSGKTLSGGLDPNAMQFPKQFFGSARNINDGGSLTIISTALVDTGSRMDDVVYEEFKGTGNMEIFLSRELSERRVFPAIDLYKSGTRREDLLLTEEELDVVFSLRRVLTDSASATDSLIDTMQKTKNNADFLSKAKAFINAQGK